VPAVTALLRRAARRIGQTPPLVIVAIAWLILIVYAFPGQMTQDSFDHLREARERRYTDSHPPAMNLVWAIAEYFVHGPFGMLVVQTVAFVAGLYLVFRRTFAPRGAAWAAAGVTLLPPVMLPMAVIWKDCLMAGFLLLGCGAMRAEHRGVRLLGLGALWVASAVRYNAFAATLPLIVLLFVWRPELPPLRRYAIAAAAWLVITVAAFAANTALTDQKMHFWHSSLAVYDICGTLAFVDEDLPDEELREELAGTQLLIERDIHDAIRRVYSPRDYQQIIKNGVGPRTHPPIWDLPINLYAPAPEAQRDALERAWKRIVASHPMAYAKHRLSVFAEVIYLGDRRPEPVTRREFGYPEYAKELGLGTGWSKLQRRMTRWMVKVGKLPLFSPWMYLALALALAPLALRARALAALLVSGVLFEMTLLPLAASPDYRYSHWMILCTVIVAVELVARRARGRSPGAPS